MIKQLACTGCGTRLGTSLVLSCIKCGGNTIASVEDDDQPRKSASTFKWLMIVGCVIVCCLLFFTVQFWLQSSKAKSIASPAKQAMTVDKKKGRI